MLVDYTDLIDATKAKFSEINHWPEIKFNEQDKIKLKEIPVISFVNDYSIQLKIDNNHAVIPSQYVLYSIAIKELALYIKDYLDAFELLKSTKTQNDVGALIINNRLNYSGFELDEFSKNIAPQIFSSNLNLGAKSIVNGTAGNYTIRGIIDYFTSIMLKFINIPNASSTILGKFVYSLTQNKSVYDYLEERFINIFPYILKEAILKNFTKKIFSFLYQYDNLETVKHLILKNIDPKASSIKDIDFTLTSIFRTSSTLLSESDLSQGGKIRYSKDPLFMFDNEFYYFSTEWTDGTDSRLDLTSLSKLIDKYYPEFKISKDDQIFYLKSTNLIKELDKSILGENTIYYGAPGTGKSFKVNEILKGKDQKFYKRITFHPEYDNTSFIGGYKPISEFNTSTNTYDIKYKFVPQAFTNIYIKAWQDPENQYYLVIEEINRGNCAEIFGEIFQLLDRESNYTVSPSFELNHYLLEELKANHEGLKNGLKLPPNLNILATMNTSDQSLFPMDSAFKRRWTWEYVPICYNNITEERKPNDSFNFYVRLDENTKFSWIEFIKAINQKIKNNINLGMDKCIGNYFINPDNREISLKEFINKAVFYLWNDVFKDEDERDSIFKKNIFYEDFFPVNPDGKKLVEDILNELSIPISTI